MFKAYDIRGTLNKDFTPQDFIKLGAALAYWLKTQNIHTLCLGNDTRPSSNTLTNALLTGLTSEKINILLQQQITTPLTVWSMMHLNEKACAMITASHNPWNDNGLKIYLNKGHVHPVCDQELLQIKDLMPNHTQFTLNQNYIKNINLTNLYINNLPKIDPSLKVLWNANFGGASKIIQKLGAHINTNPNLWHTLPNGPDPINNTNLPEHPLILSLDGDGDRLSIQLNNKIISCEEIAATFKAQKIIHDPHVSFKFKQLKENAQLFEAKVGHSNIQKAMIEHNADIGFETSGHFFFKETANMDDAIYAGLLFIQNMHKFQKINSFISPIYRLKLPDSIFEQMIKIAQNTNAQINLTDGIKIIYEYGWILARKSNTENCISIAFEGKNQNSYNIINEKFNFLFKN